MSRRGHGEGSIYKREDGRWAAAITLEGRKRKAFYGKTRQEVARTLAAAIRNRDLGLLPSPERETLGQFLVRWLEITKPTVRPRTFTRYEQYIRVHAIPQIGHLRLAKLAPQNLQALYAMKLEAGLSSTSVAHLHAVLHRALSQALRWGHVGTNIADMVDPPRIVRQEIKALTPEQVRRFLEAASGERLEALYVLAVTTGMRQGELLPLHWKDIDLEQGTLQVRGTLQRTKEGFTVAEPKTGRSRRLISLAPMAISALKKHHGRQLEERLACFPMWQDDDLLFCNTVGRPLEAGNLLRRSFWTLLTKASLPRVRFHDLRHTAATLLLSKGIHPKIVQELLGHSQISVTLDTYSHVLPTLQREAVGAFEELLAGGK